MADIELVIRVPEEVVKNGDYVSYFGIVSEKLVKTIKNGTQLPKGHGRLIDADDLKRIGRYAHTNTDIDNASTIIEADRSKNDNT